MQSNPALDIRNLSVDVGGKPYVQGVSLAAPKGEVHCLLGPNGAGKTTVLRTIYRAERPAAGEIAADGRDIEDYAYHEWARKCGALVQSSGLLAGLTPSDIVEIGLSALGLDGVELVLRRDEALKLVGLIQKRNQPADRLSGGELQRCYFAQLLACDPEIYILDEPTNHLDLHYQLVLLNEVKRRGRTVLMTLHDLNLVARYCDHVHLMSRGRIVDHGKPADVLSRQNLMEHFLVDAHLNMQSLVINGPVMR
ncbi:ABC transporter ATP-binding protein [Roseibium sp. RKSG952]|uniref:ABC transporter ATP-binding protein n=1 Tax=Roseibium sp. RKSG952 TaxID=2529384 RepID=UPI0013C57858|nr:ABC transporter ATP-binding protein [Roseibium sp. RKSG952]